MEMNELANLYLGYKKNLQENRAQARWFQLVPAGMQVHDIRSGDAVMIKVYSRKTKLDPKWEGLYTVLLTSYFAVKVAEKDNCIHHSYSHLDQGITRCLAKWTIRDCKSRTVSYLSIKTF
ncbi:hypothetical protein QYF61_013302 [Mycteria americana]|uniref:Murine leukemia virus integrase C-terminal domain-containing protein n=1 Tax=Mycteria americana TaxID=33587 RepID=A0AAN7MRA1_MYCAM|nr:hypothetical protein QYF61_013302 [Mycteria americana]